MLTSMPTSHILRLLTPEKGAMLLKASGFDAVDYSAPTEYYEPYTGLYTLPDAEFDAFFRRDGEALRAAGLRIYQVHAPYHTIPDDEAETDFMRAAIRRSVHATAVVGGEYLVIHPAQPMHWSTDTDPAYTRQYNYDFLAELIPIARAEGVKLALENMPGAGIPTGTPTGHIDYIDMMNATDVLFACLDTGHANFSRVDPGVWARMLGDRLKVLHVHDNFGDRDAHLLPHLGSISWGSFLTALKEIGYTGTYSLEASFHGEFGDKLLPDTLRFMQAVANEINL